MNYRSSGPSTWGGDLIFLEDDHSKKGSPLVMQGKLDFTWPAQLIGLEERLR